MGDPVSKKKVFKLKDEKPNRMQNRITEIIAFMVTSVFKVVIHNIQLFNMKCTHCYISGLSLLSMAIFLKQKTRKDIGTIFYVSIDKTESLSYGLEIILSVKKP